MADSTTSPAARKPDKPRPDFPLFPHANGKWAKKVRGKLHYFGKWDDPQAALESWLEQKDDLLAGRVPRKKSEGVTVRDLCNRYLTHQLRKLEAGELSQRSFEESLKATDRIVEAFGPRRVVVDIQPGDFAPLRASMASTLGPVALGVTIQRVKSVFKYCFDSGLLPAPVRYGTEFAKPSKSVLRRHRAAQGPRLFTADEIRRMLDAASVPLRAMLYLGINAGYGNHDCGTLPLAAVDLDGGWIRYPRPKTGIDRRCPLWAETVAALKAALAVRPEPADPDHAGHFFLTRTGKQPWAGEGRSDAVTHEARRLLRKLSINGRKGLGFYSLRHTFRTIADGAKDANAIRAIMGHVDDSIDANYTHGIDDERLRDVVNHVRAWLFGDGEAK